MKPAPKRRAIGQYELLDRIGEGGMAEVYLGIKHGVSNIRTFYAVKLVKPDHAADDRFSRMFLDEARVMASVQHPNLVTLHDMLVDEGQYVIIMEYLKGLDLRRLCRTPAGRRQLPISIAVNIVHQACVGLHYAHDAKSIEGEWLQLVHRDISPHNLFVTFDGYVKVLDFGIAKSEIQDEETKSGILKGKIPYLSPEQCASDAVIDRKTDVWALGVVLFELLTGRRPFEGRNEIQVIQSILYSPPPSPTTFAPRIPAELAEIVLKALASNPDERFSSCEVLRDALARVSKRNGWSLNERALSKYIQEVEYDHMKELEQRLVALVNASAVDASNSQLTIYTDDTSSQKLTLGPDCVATQRHKGDLSAYRLSGQIRETFQPESLCEKPHRTLVVDLAGISRLTSFGIRGWLTMLPALTEKNDRVLLNRVSVALANQFVTIPAMTEGVRILSMMAPFRCAACGHQFDGVIRTGQPITMVLKCVRCGEAAANFDEDDAYLMPMVDHGAKAEGALASFVELVEETDESGVTAVEKVVTSERTEIHLRGDVPDNTRWDRLLAGVEGDLRITIAPGCKLSQQNWLRVEAELRRVESDAVVTIVGFPIQAASELDTLSTVHPAIRTAYLSSSCPHCQTVEFREWTSGTIPSTVCRQCGKAIERKTAPTEQPTQDLVTAPSPPEEMPPQKSNKSMGLTLAIVVLVILIVLAILI